MGGHWRGARWLLLPLACAAPTLYLMVFRHRLLTWGATPDEVAARYPGDDLVPEPDGSSIMATTLPGPPEQVWPWLVQMGYDRAGWYSWDRIDHGGKPSAARIVPEWQHLEPGQHLSVVASGESWFTVAMVEPERTLVLRSSTELPSGRPFDARSASLPRAYMDGIWGFYLQPADGGRTRLVVRVRGRSRPRALMAPFDLLVGEPGHFIMQARQFRNLRARVRARARSNQQLTSGAPRPAG